MADECTVGSVGELIANLLVGDVMIASLLICGGRLSSGDSDRQMFYCHCHIYFRIARTEIFDRL